MNCSKCNDEMVLIISLKDLKFKWDMSKGVTGKNKIHDLVQSLYNSGNLSIHDYRDISIYMNKDFES